MVKRDSLQDDQSSSINRSDESVKRSSFTSGSGRFARRGETQYVMAEGDNSKLTQCFLSPRLKIRLSRNQLPFVGIKKLSGVPEQKVITTTRVDQVMVNAIVRYIQLETFLSEEDLAEIVSIVKDQSLSNPQVVQNILKFFPTTEDMSLHFQWQGLATYIMHTNDPTQAKEAQPSFQGLFSEKDQSTNKATELSPDLSSSNNRNQQKPIGRDQHAARIAQNVSRNSAQAGNSTQDKKDSVGSDKPGKKSKQSTLPSLVKDTKGVATAKFATTDQAGATKPGGRALADENTAKVLEISKKDKSLKNIALMVMKEVALIKQFVRTARDANMLLEDVDIEYDDEPERQSWVDAYDVGKSLRQIFGIKEISKSGSSSDSVTSPPSSAPSPSSGSDTSLGATRSKVTVLYDDQGKEAVNASSIRKRLRPFFDAQRKRICTAIVSGSPLFDQNGREIINIPSIRNVDQVFDHKGNLMVNIAGLSPANVKQLITQIYDAKKKRFLLPTSATESEKAEPTPQQSASPKPALRVRKPGKVSSQRLIRSASSRGLSGTNIKKTASRDKSTTGLSPKPSKTVSSMGRDEKTMARLEDTLPSKSPDITEDRQEFPRPSLTVVGGEREELPRLSLIVGSRQELEDEVVVVQPEEFGKYEETELFELFPDGESKRIDEAMLPKDDEHDEGAERKSKVPSLPQLVVRQSSGEVREVGEVGVVGEPPSPEAEDDAILGAFNALLGMQEMKLFDAEGNLEENIEESLDQEKTLYDEQGRELVYIPGEDEVKEPEIAKKKRRGSKKMTKRKEVDDTPDTKAMEVTVTHEEGRQTIESTDQIIQRALREPDSLIDINTDETRAARMALAPAFVVEDDVPEPVQEKPPKTRPAPDEPLADMPRGEPVAMGRDAAAKMYMEKHGITEIFEMLLSQLLLERPKTPLDFLIDSVHDMVLRQKTGTPLEAVHFSKLFTPSQQDLNEGC